MKRKALLIIMLMAMFAPLAMYAQQALPYSYGFEDDELPSTWTMNNCTSGEDGNTGIFTMSDYAHSGTNVFGFLYTSNPPQYLIAPEISGPRTGVLVEFYYRNYNTNYGVESFKVGYSTGKSNTMFNNYSWTDEITLPQDTEWHLFSETFTDSGIKHICIQCTSDDVMLLMIDDFTVSEIPSCFTPSDLTVSNLSARTADLSWTPNANGSENAWQIMVNERETIDVEDRPSYSFTGLTPETTYTVKVRANCGNNSYSNWSDIISFTTDPSCFAPEEVTVSDITPVSASVSWTGDANSFDVQLASTGDYQISNTWLQYDDGAATNYYGSTTSSTWIWGAMYPASMLSGNIATLQKVAVYETSYYTSDYYVYIGIGGEEAPEELVYAQSVTPVGNGWNEITLDEPVSLDPEQNVWIILQVTGTYVLTVGNCSDANNQWYYGSGWVNSGISGKGWLIRGEFEGITYNANSLSWNTIENAGSPYAMNNLAPATLYLGKVRANCGNEDGYSNWVDFFFYTPSACDAPTDLTVSNITNSTANLSWSGYADTYNVRYRTIAQHNVDDFSQVGRNTTATGNYTDYTFNLSAYSGQGYIAIRHYNVTDMFWLDIASVTVKNTNGDVVFASDFSAGLPDNWSTIDNDGDGNNWIGTAGFVYSESYNNAGALTPDNWLITPMVDLGGSVVVNAKGQDASYASEVFGVFVSTTPLEENEWIVKEAVNGTSYAFTDLESEALYEAQVQAAGCENAEWSNSVTFTTLADNVFITEGNWNVASNWKNNVVPEDGADVLIQANCIIPANYTANAGTITIGETGSLTIKDGGRLIHTNEGVIATMEKEITGYKGAKDNYYLIASPANTIFTYNGYTYAYTDPAEVENMLSGDYDLYGFDCTEDLEWLNYEADVENFIMWQGMGYLYANSADVTLSFTGELHPFESDFANNSSFLTYEASDEAFTGFNLVGNLFATDGYIVIADYDSEEGIITGLSEDVYFYTMGDGELTAGTGAVAPMQGVMVQASSDSQVALCYTSALRNNSALNLTVSNANGMVDAAYIRFNGNSELSKIQLNPNHTKLFFTKDNKDFAVVSSEAQGEMPVSFKAEKNGTYTLSFSNENVEFSYLHLIDNMTGNDVDLLENPSYSFEAKTTDYASRFRLVFSTGTVTDDNFAFYTDGTIVINNEGNATMNVYDVTGRLVNTQSVNGSCQVNLNAPAGVYMIQLVNGDNTKTQKIVVK